MVDRQRWTGFALHVVHLLCKLGLCNISVVLTHLWHHFRSFVVAIVFQVTAERQAHALTLFSLGSLNTELKVVVLCRLWPIILSVNSLTGIVVIVRPPILSTGFLTFPLSLNWENHLLAVYRHTTCIAEALGKHLQLMPTFVCCAQRFSLVRFVNTLSYTLFVLINSKSLTSLHSLLCGGTPDVAHTIAKVLARQSLIFQTMMDMDFTRNVAPPKAPLFHRCRWSWIINF
mmetsp:Transcript_88305/g.152893  ORF Transcript_88305/g.152893 Transcript_88305/m.152893 type:complete len:230 (+) Transcript_88305:593-1282(+)